MTKFLNISKDNTLGGNSPSDILVVSQKAIKDYVDNEITSKTAQATETTLGTVKTNPSDNIDLNSDGQLVVGGRMGQFAGTSGMFAPNDRDPRTVNNYSLLITDAKGMSMSANRSLAIVSGLNVNLRSYAQAGSTQYMIANNYSNRIIAKCCENGYIALNEATSTQQRIEPVLSVTINGSSFTPDSSADNGSAPIVITVANSINPSTSVNQIRLFGSMSSYATAHLGNGVSTPGGGGRSLVIGGGVTKYDGNDACVVGMNMYCKGNGNAMFGKDHISAKNRGFFAGQGHDGTNAKAEGVSAVGVYSRIDSNTAFAVGNGTSPTARSNAFEVTNDGGIVLKSPNGTRYKITVNNNGVISATAI